MAIVPQVNIKYNVNVEILDDAGNVVVVYDWKTLKVLDFYPTTSNPEVYHFAALIENKR